jgi:cytochrome c oxidase cbb3-type subunit III
MVRGGTLARALFVALLLTQAGCPKSDAGAAPDGRGLFAATCARCHGESGTGGLPLWEGGPSPRNFHDREFLAGHTDSQLIATIKNGKPPGMPAFGSTFSEPQLHAIVAYIRSFEREKAK